jgi:hypothetical protein
LTSKGKKFVSQLKIHLEKLRDGIPFPKDKKLDPLKIMEAPGPWFTGSVKKKVYVTNGKFMCFAKPYSRMKAEKGTSELRHKIGSLVLSAAKNSAFNLQVFPSTLQRYSLADIPILHFTSKDKKYRAAINQVYYEYLVHKFPSTTFFTSGKKIDGKTAMIIGKCRQQGFYGDVVSLIAVVE